jgi:hypothetical protein
MDFVNSVTLDVNGKKITNFKKFTDKEQEYNKQVKLMGKVGHMSVTPVYGCLVDYVIPSSDPEIDWRTVRDARLTVELNNGKRWTYTGVSALKVGEAVFDDESEVVRTIDLGASGRVEE